jgi:hypothetical protein
LAEQIGTGGLYQLNNRKDKSIRAGAARRAGAQTPSPAREAAKVGASRPAGAGASLLAAYTGTFRRGEIDLAGSVDFCRLRGTAASSRAIITAYHAMLLRNRQRKIEHNRQRKVNK